jgi:hypothetical protein
MGISNPIDYRIPPSRLELIRKWHELATTDPAIQNNVFFKFVATWVAFNAFYAEMFPSASGDRNQVKKYSLSDTAKRKHSELLKTREYKAAVEFFCRSGVRSETEPAHLYDTEKIFNQVYQVRCNLFHGGKLPENPRDYKLVESAYAIVSRIVELELNELIHMEDQGY